jgi:hypothetical protein
MERQSRLLLKNDRRRTEEDVRDGPPRRETGK